ncbi:MAG: SDR family oxidoreductase [Rhodothermales bacterium]|nr:SDR family oxidoreductase [Rhodothermales bacterium]MBO6781572.1 SDR family oxidoreductase [Rhodothermales bacterium]
MDLGLKDRVAVVTGASRGIGRGIAESLAREGCKLVVCARGEERLEETATALRELGAEVVAVSGDVTSAEGAVRPIETALSEFGAVHVLVSNVGGNRRGRFADTSDDDWEAVLDANLRAHIRVARRAVPAMEQSGGGAITFTASIFGREGGGPGLSIYNSTKSALISMAKIMAMELAEKNIRVNTIAPGSIRFPGGSWDRRCNEDPEGMKAFIADNLPFGRFGRVEEVADTAAFLSSDRASWISGACLNVDGVQSKSLI